MIFSLEISRFSEIKTAYSTDVANSLLLQFASRLKTALKQAHTIARIAEDQFIFYVSSPQLGSKDDIVGYYVKVLERTFTIENNNQILDAHFGISIYGTDGQTATVLLEKANLAKDNARTSAIPYSFYIESISIKLAKDFEFESLFRHALLTETLEIVYQPKICLSSMKICGAEALCRWNHVELGQVPPSVFIALAEKSDLIIQLGEFVLKTVASQQREWLSANIPIVPVAVNISGKHLLKSNLKNFIEKTLSDNKLMGNMINIEVTESALIESLLYALQAMKNISELGIAFSLDDFGTGYSSLSYLQKLPLHYLKIDKSFVDEIMNDKQSANVTKTIVSMAQINNLVTIAEGVENKEQMQFLKDIGCDQIQGYYFSKPINKNDFLKLLLEDKIFT